MFDVERKKTEFLEDVCPLVSIVFTIVFLVACLVMCSGLEVHAQEIDKEELDDDYSQTDLEQDERLNSLEIRLEELGYIIDETSQSIILLQETDADLEQQRLELSEKLDLCIIALNDLINYSVEQLEKMDSSEVLTESYRTALLEELEANRLLVTDLNDNTVSGNMIISDFNDSVSENLQLTSENTLQELNKTLLTTNTFLSYVFILLLGVLVLFITFGIGALIHKLLSHVR